MNQREELTNEQKPKRKVNSSDRRQIYLICALLVVVTICAYGRVIGFSLLRLDDDAYVQQNPMVNGGLAPSSVVRAFSSPYIDNYIPLVWISLMTDRDIAENLLGSDSPSIFHATNLALHLANVILLFFVLLKLTGFRGRSALVAALFAVHPLHVESVAWVAERKDVLSTLFWLLTMLAYIRYAKRPNARAYGLVVVLLGLGLMAKPMLVTLPLTLLLLDYWPLGRMRDSEGRVTWAGLWRMTSEKASLFVLAAAGCVITILSQQHAGAVASIASYSLGVRIATAFVSYIGYIGKMIWPAGLSCMYVHPGNTLPLWKVIGSALLMGALTAAALRMGRRRPYVTFGWLWYVITLIPVIGLVQVGWQATADRYTYVPLIGLFVIVVWGVPDLLAKSRYSTLSHGRLLPLASVTLVALLGVLTYNQVGYWRDDTTLLRHAIRVNFKDPFAHNNLGAALAAQGRVDEAIREYAIAVEQRPDYVKALCNLASNLGRQGKTDEAMRYLRKALRVAPECVPAHECLGVMLAQKGRLDEAIAQFKDAVRFDPADTNARDLLQQAEEQKQSETR